MTMAKRSKIGQVFHELRWQLGQILHQSPEEISPSHLLVNLVPPQDRRRIWEELRQSGVELPALQLGNPVLLMMALVILIPVFVLAMVRKTPLVFLCLIELIWIARKLTRPWAISPPIGCETVQEAALCITSFRQNDFRAGLWPREDISAKVRWILAQRLGIPFQEIADETKIADLCC
jgi:hypothetical protein